MKKKKKNLLSFSLLLGMGCIKAVFDMWLQGKNYYFLNGATASDYYCKYVSMCLVFFFLPIKASISFFLCQFCVYVCVFLL